MMSTTLPSSSLHSSSSSPSCSVRLSTLIKKINLSIPNRKNASIILDFHKHMQEKGSSENHQLNNLKVVINFAKFLGHIAFYDVKKREQVIIFLKTKIRTPDVDPDKRWITTWNHDLNRIKLFVRWLYNVHLQHEQDLQEMEEWITPDSCKIINKL